MFKSSRTFLPLTICVVLMGCGQTKPEQKPTPPPNSAPTTTAPGNTGIGTNPDGTATTAAGPKSETGNSPATGMQGKPATLFTEGAYLPDDIVGIVVANPRRMTEWNVYSLLKKAKGILPYGVENDLEAIPNLEHIERVVLVFDQKFVKHAAAKAGLEEKKIGDVDGDTHEQPVPLVVFSLTQPLEVAKHFSSFDSVEEADGEKIRVDSTPSALWESPDKKTILVGSIEDVLSRVAANKAGKSSNSKLLSQLNTSTELSMAFALNDQTELIERAVQLGEGIPGLAMVQQITGITLHLSVLAKPGSKMIDFVATTVDEDAAKQISDFLSPLLDNGKGLAKEQMTAFSAIADDNSKAGLRLAEQLVESAAIAQAGAKVTFTLAAPEGFDKLAEILKPTIEQANVQAGLREKSNNLKRIGLAFHNYHDANLRFPGAGKSAEGKSGLSWRVHLLPYLDQSELYQKFKLDEPWDSENNKALIAEMPFIFNTDGFAPEDGKTSIHVMTGPGAPFANDATPKMRDFTDGISNVILFLVAGPDKAEVWTKPGGLDFDPADPLKALGKVSGETFSAVLADGAYRAISKKIAADQLRKLIQSGDGEPLGEF